MRTGTWKTEVTTVVRCISTVELNAEKLIGYKREKYCILKSGGP